VDVSVLIVSWNVAPLLEQCLLSIPAALGRLCGEVVVVDNASADGSAEVVRTHFPSVRILPERTNLGFARAMNVALASASGRYSLLLNPDTILPPSAIEALAGFLDKNPDVALVGPRLIYPDGRPQGISARLLPSLTLAVAEALQLTLVPQIGQKIIQRYVSPYDLTRGRPVEAVQPVAALARTEILRDLGGFGEGFPLGGEDMDLCFRLHRTDKKIFYFPDVEVVHLHGQSIRKAIPESRTKLAISMYRYFERCRGRSHAIIYRVLMQLVQPPLLLIVGLLALATGRETRREFRERLLLCFYLVVWRVPDGRDA
jgi:GT2 family glycosyltransferase